MIYLVWESIYDDVECVVAVYTEEENAQKAVQYLKDHNPLCYTYWHEAVQLNPILNLI